MRYTFQSGRIVKSLSSIECLKTMPTDVPSNIASRYGQVLRSVNPVALRPLQKASEAVHVRIRDSELGAMRGEVVALGRLSALYV